MHGEPDPLDSEEPEHEPPPHGPQLVDPPEFHWRASDHPDYDVPPAVIDLNVLTESQANFRIADEVWKRFPGRFWSRPGHAELFSLDHDTGQLSVVSDGVFRALLPRVVELRAANNRVINVTASTSLKVRLGEGHWPVLEHVRFAPWYTPEGRLVNEPGFDEETGIWLHWRHDAFADPDAVTDADVAEVLDRLTDFSFESPSDEAAFVAALVQYVTDHRGEPCPLTLINATEQDSGKSYLHDLIVEIACARQGVLTGEVGSTSLDKSLNLNSLLQAAGRKSVAVVAFDNLETCSDLNFGRLNQLLTSRSHEEGRVVGSGIRGGSNPSHYGWLANGNQLKSDLESARRQNQVRIAPRSKGRRFRTPNLREWVRHNRVLIISVLLRLVCEWQRADRPRPPRELSSFEWWSLHVGGPVCHARPRWRDAWLAPTSRPADPAEAQLIELIEMAFEDGGWARDDEGRLAPMRTSAILEAARESALWSLVEVSEGGRSKRAALTRFGAFLTSLHKRKRTLLAGESPWRIERRPLRGWTGYVPISVDDSDGWSERTGETPPPDCGCRTSAEHVGPDEQRSHTESGGGKGTCRTCRTCRTSSTPPGSQDNRPDPETGPTGPTGPTNQGSTYGPGVGPHVGPSGGPTPEPGPRRGAGPGPGPGSPVRPSADFGPDTVIPGVHRLDPARDAILAVAARGLPADPDVLAGLLDEGLARLREDGSDRARERRQVILSLRDGGPDYASALAQARVSGRVRARWRTQPLGRIQTYEPNLQGVTKLFGTRMGFAAPQGMRLVIGDWRTAHLQIAATLAGEQAALEALARGDLYARAAEAWGPELGEDAGRGLAKRCILSYLNGGNGRTFANWAQEFGLEVDDREMMVRRERWLMRYPRLRAFMDGLWSRPIRAVRPGLWRASQPTPTKGGRSACRRRGNSHLWQATEADAVRRVLLASSDPIVFMVHDEIILEVDEADADQAAQRLRVAMRDALAQAIRSVRIPGNPAELSRDYDVPAARAVKVSIGTSWGDTAEVAS